MNKAIMCLSDQGFVEGLSKLYRQLTAQATVLSLRNTFLARLGYAWQHPVKSFDEIRSIGFVSSVMFGGVEAVNSVAFVLGGVGLENYAWTSCVFLGALANASYVIAKSTELPK